MENYIDNDMKDEVLTGHKPIPMKIAIKVMKSICKIIIMKEKGKNYGTGFFMRISDSFKCLITNYHVLNPQLIHLKIEIEIWNNKNIPLNLNNLYIKYFEKPIDITIIKINELEDIFKDIEFLDYDTNYNQKGYSIYKDVDIFSVQHPFGDDAACASGKISAINGYEFNHKIPTEQGSSGCPIILLNQNINLIQVIGIHKKGDNNKGINCGTFIGEIIEGLNKDSKKILNNLEINENPKEDLKEIPDNENINYIIGQISVTINEVKKDIYILL